MSTISSNFLHVLCGSEPFLLRKQLDYLRLTFKKQGYTEHITYAVNKKFSWDTFEIETKTSSLFSELKLIELHFFEKPSIAEQKQLQKIKVEDFLESIVIITIPEITFREQKSEWYKSLEKKGQVTFFNALTREKLTAWIKMRLAKQQQLVDDETLVFLTRHFEGNLLSADQELKKMSLVYPIGKLNGRDVRLNILNLSRFEPEQLNEELLRGDFIKILQLLRGAEEEGMSIISLLYPLIWTITTLYQAKLMIQRGSDINLALKEAKIFFEKQKLSKQILPKLSLRQLRSAVIKLSDIDKISKGVKDGNAWVEIERFCLQFAKACTK